MTTFAGGGGLGDSVYILAKFRQLSRPGDELIFVNTNAAALEMVTDFYLSQSVKCSFRLVEDNDTAVRGLRAEGCKILNTMWAGRPRMEPSKWSTYPFDAELNPYMDFESASDARSIVEANSLDRSGPNGYFVVVTNAGTVKYGKSKNWERVSWINDFIRLQRPLECILIGTENPGIVGGVEFTRTWSSGSRARPFPEILALIKGAEFVLGLQGFVSIAALFMHKAVVLKYESLQVTFNHLHPAWSSHLTLFGEHSKLDARSIIVPG